MMPYFLSCIHTTPTGDEWTRLVRSASTGPRPGGKKIVWRQESWSENTEPRVRYGLLFIQNYRILPQSFCLLFILGCARAFCWGCTWEPWWQACQALQQSTPQCVPFKLKPWVFVFARCPAHSSGWWGPWWCSRPQWGTFQGSGALLGWLHGCILPYIHTYLHTCIHTLAPCQRCGTCY